MKKLFNSRFLFILASSLVVLIGLTIGAFYLFDDEDNKFVKSGYVLNPLSSTSEKYFFDKDAGYKENLSSMIEFVDVDKNTVSVLKDSFLHYSDDSLSFLKRGALLDLDSIRGSKAVSFYNISSESLIEKKDSGYFIESSNGDINLANFMGRISDNKYIVVGDLKLKMAGNETAVDGNYFEIVYVEEGIVNIENKDIKFQVAAADTVISVGSHIKIDLGEKKITYDKEDIMSITAITIDGNENIEIIPKVEDEEEEQPQGGGSGNGEGNGTGDGNGSGGGQGEGNNGSTNENDVTEPVDEIIVNLKNVNIGSAEVDIVFEVLNAKENDSLKLQVINLASGKTVDIESSVLDNVLIEINLLDPNTKYLFVVLNEKTNNKYFQKVIETSGFGIKLEKIYATDSSLKYEISIDENTDITNAKLTLLKFNEETQKNEVVKTAYVDSVTNEVVYEEQIVPLTSFAGNMKGVHEVLYEGLDSDTIYTAVLDEFSVVSTNYKEKYNITVTSMTLKKTPMLTEMMVETNAGTSFELALKNIDDPDRAITDYSYYIYDKSNNTLATGVPIVKTTAEPISVLIGNGVGELKSNGNYYCNVVVEYFDNEKYVEYMTTVKVDLSMGSDPYVKITPNEAAIKHDSIGATLTLIDEGCTVSIPGRKNCDGPSSTVIEVSVNDPVYGVLDAFYVEQMQFLVDGNNITYVFYLDNEKLKNAGVSQKLTPGTTYHIELKSKLNNSDEVLPEKIYPTANSKDNITTKYLSSFNVGWNNYPSNADHVVNASVRLFHVDGVNTLTDDESLEMIDRVVIKMYNGRQVNSMMMGAALGAIEIKKSDNVDFKQLIYDAVYDISSTTTFNLPMDKLKCLNAEVNDNECLTGKLSEYYTLTIDAYTAEDYMITLINRIYSYKVNPILLADGLADPVLKVSPIVKSNVKEHFTELSGDEFGSTIVGYNVSSSFDRTSFIEKDMLPYSVTYYVYNTNKEKVSFYILDENNELKIVDGKKGYESRLGDIGFDEINIYMNSGTSYETVDTTMTRGNTYYIGYEFKINVSGSGFQNYPFKSGEAGAPDGGTYKKQTPEKASPDVKVMLHKSDANSIIYEYEIKDPDLSLYKNPEDTDYSFYYSISGRSEKSIQLTPVAESDFNHFKGEMRIDNLNQGDLYKIYYYANKTKSGNPDNDIKKVLDNYANGDRLFEGYYEPTNYNFTYEIINDPSKDNKVGIKVLTHDIFLERILSYQVEFTVLNKDGNVEKRFIKELWELNDCPDGELSRCLFVDYTELNKAGMKSEIVDGKLVVKDIHVKVTAYYDTGLSGFGYKVGNSEGMDYAYTILQDFTTKNPNTGDMVLGNYISFNAARKSLVVWNENLGVIPGYYTYSWSNPSKAQMDVTGYWLEQDGDNNYILKSKSVPTPGVVNSAGYYSSRFGYLNPKMIESAEMSAYKESTFYFDSITPKVTIPSFQEPLINGAYLTLSLSGIDLNELKPESDGKYYVYIEVWDDMFKAGDCNDEGCFNTVRPLAKGEINPDKPLSKIYVPVDGLEESGDKSSKTYYYQVFVNQIKYGEYKYTQLFDATENGNVSMTYKFTTLKASKLIDPYADTIVGSTSIETYSEPYGKRELKTTIGLNDFSVYNFDLVYVLCKTSSGCGIDVDETGVPEEQRNVIFQKTIPQGFGKEVNDVVDVTELKSLVYGKRYTMYVYAISDYYNYNDETKEFDISKRSVLLNSWSPYIDIRRLTVPEFGAIRDAYVENNNYYVDITMSVVDSDKVLTNGKYYISFMDENGNDLLTGTKGNCDVCLEVMDENGNYVKQDGNYIFDAMIQEQKIRITGLSENTKYNFKMYNDKVYINNLEEKDKNGRPIDGTGLLTNVSKTYIVYSANMYGVAIAGKDVSFTGRANSVVVLFDGGSSFDNVVNFGYSIFTADSVLKSGEFLVGEGGKQFIPGDKVAAWRFVIDPDDLTLVANVTYKITISLTIKTGENTTIVLDSTNVPGFSGSVTYSTD